MTGVIIFLGIVTLSIIIAVFREAKKRLAEYLVGALTPKNSEEIKTKIETICVRIDDGFSAIHNELGLLKSNVEFVGGAASAINDRITNNEQDMQGQIKQCGVRFDSLGREIAEIKIKLPKVNGKKKINSQQYSFKGTCLIIDDNEHFRSLMSTYMISEGYDVSLAESYKDAMLLVKGRGRFDVWLIDQVLTDGSGIDLWKMVYQKFPGTKAIIVSGYDIQGQMKDLQDMKHVRKDLDNNDMFKKINFMLDNWENV
jgi:CheY-like chemotaxis protein